MLSLLSTHAGHACIREQATEVICKGNCSGEVVIVRRGGHIPESKWRWEGAISAESSRGHAVGSGPMRPVQHRHRLSGHYFLLTPSSSSTPILPLPLHYRKQAREERQELVLYGPWGTAKWTEARPTIGEGVCEPPWLPPLPARW